MAEQASLRALRHLLLPALLALQYLPLHGQNLNLGTPPIRNFSKKNYRAGTQTWDMAQDERGVMYFANNQGLLEFDGNNWRLFPLANNTIVRSVCIGKDKRIYVGGQGDFGYFSPNKNGQLVFHSLKDALPESQQNFSDVWDILVREEGVFFRASDRIFLLRGTVVHVFLSGRALEFLGLLQNKVVVQDANYKLYEFNKNEFQAFGNAALPVAGFITAILPYHVDTQLVTTIKDGIFYYSKSAFGTWKTSSADFLKANRIYCAGLLEDGKIAVGTSLSGMVVLDRQGRIFQHLAKKSGLQNNTVLSIFPDKAGSLWLGLDNGIDLVAINSPFSNIFPDGDLQGTGYALEIFAGKIYFGTNTGLYCTDWKAFYPPEEQHPFQLVANTKGQVWGLNRLGNSLLLGHHEGAFDVRDHLAQKIAELPGVWKFLPISATTALAGHYNGVAFFKKTNAQWHLSGQPKGLSESSRILEKSANGKVWIAHPYRGAYRLDLDTATQNIEIEFFNVKNGLPSDFNNYVFKLGDLLVFAAEKGIFSFDETLKRFVPNEEFNNIFGEKTRVKYLRQDGEGNIWYVAGDEVGVLMVEDKGLEKKVRRRPIPELSGKLVGGFEFVLPVDRRNVFFATEQGFVHFNPSNYFHYDSSLQLVLHEVRLDDSSDSLIFGGHLMEGAVSPPVLSHRQNALRFIFSATDYNGSEHVQYAHFLEGAEQGWSDWSHGTKLVFNNLSPGSYRLHLKAKNAHGAQGQEIAYEFEIMPPWYANPFAFSIYALLGLGAVAAMLYRQRRRFDRERRAMQTSHQQREEQHQAFARQSEEAISRLQQEKLEAEVLHKNQELATATLHLVQKSEMLSTIKSALVKLEKNMQAQPTVKKEIQRIVKMVEQDVSLDEDWEHFSQNFDQVHSDFLKRLAEHYPHLSPNDFKLSAYLRMNLSTKEIAALLNISVRGVEASRYRLRKRLGLGTEVNLTEFLMRL